MGVPTKRYRIRSHNGTMPVDLSEFTNTQQKLLIAMADGKYHHKLDLVKLLPDDMTSPSTVAVHINNINKKLEPKGMKIFCISKGYNRYYVWTRLLRSED